MWFFACRHFFVFRPRGLFSCSRLRDMQGARAYNTAQSVGPGRGPWHVLWGFKVTKTDKQPRGGIASTYESHLGTCTPTWLKNVRQVSRAVLLTARTDCLAT